jgi:hypothetical protein
MPARGNATRFERRNASLRFATAMGPVEVTFCSSRIVRVTVGAGDAQAASYVGSRVWPPPPFEVGDGEPVRLATSDLSRSAAMPG